MKTLQRLGVCTSTTLLLCVGVANAQPGPPTTYSEATLSNLHSEVLQLRSEIQSLRRALAELTLLVHGDRDAPAAVFESAVDRDPAALVSSQPQPITPEVVDMMRTQIEELSQTKVESASRFPVKISGTILTNFFANSGRANWLDNPNLVEVEDANPAGSASAAVRQSRIGLATSGLQINDWHVTGTMIMDFFGGTPNFQTGTVMGLPRLIYAFGRAETEHTAVQVGQDHVILAPRDPTSLAAFSFPLLFRSGNLYLRAPHARIERRLGSGWSIAGGIVAPIAGDASRSYEFVPVAGAGERSKRPAIESRLAFAHGDEHHAGEIGVGVSGHYGWRRTGAALTNTWAAALDFSARASVVGVSGEYYIAEHAEPFGGGISQSGRSAGGWIEGRVAATARTRLIAGVGVDRPADRVATSFRARNRTLFGSAIVDLTPELAVSGEYRWMTTRLEPVTRSLRNHHFNVAFGVKF